MSQPLALLPSHLHDRTKRTLAVGLAAGRASSCVEIMNVQSSRLANKAAKNGDDYGTVKVSLRFVNQQYSARIHSKRGSPMLLYD